VGTTARWANKSLASLVLLAFALLGTACDEDPDAQLREQTEASNEVVVPALSGRDVEEAGNLLEADGLGVEIERQVFPNAEPGTVVDTQPPGGTLVERGTTVTITIARRR
jgi:beta-lactam-binding protein with PASTA domain